MTNIGMNLIMTYGHAARGADDLKPGTANHRRLSTRRAIISCGERQKPTGLRTVFRLLRQTTQLSLAESLDICLIEEELAGALPVGARIGCRAAPARRFSRP